jgi:hypothetical protein
MKPLSDNERVLELAGPENVKAAMTEGRADRAAPTLNARMETWVEACKAHLLSDPNETSAELLQQACALFFDALVADQAASLSALQRELEDAFNELRLALLRAEKAKAEVSALRDQLAQAKSDVLAVAKEIRDEARDCRRSAGIPCQSEYSWHAATYEGWAARLEAATYQHGGAASVVGGLSANHQAVALTDTLRQQVRQLADEMEAAAPLLNEWADRFRELAQ